jgi:hypothetical protein
MIDEERRRAQRRWRREPGHVALHVLSRTRRRQAIPPNWLHTSMPSQPKDRGPEGPQPSGDQDLDDAASYNHWLRTMAKRKPRS